jgi:hypothetical protein
MGEGVKKEMKRRSSKIMIVSLTMLIIFFVISTSYAGAMIAISGRVTFLGLGIKGAKVEAIGGAQTTETETTAFGYYTILHDIKKYPTTIKITAYTKYGDKSNSINDVSPGTGPYWITIRFGIPDSVSIPVTTNPTNAQNTNQHYSINSLILRILAQHPNMFPILRYINGI